MLWLRCLVFFPCLLSIFFCWSFRSFIHFLLIYRVCPLGTLLSSFHSLRHSLFSSPFLPLSLSHLLLPSCFIPLSLPPSLLPSFLPFSLPSLFVRNNTPVAQTVKNLPPVWETWVRSLGLEDPLEKGMATHSSIFAWKTPGIEEPGGLLSMGLHRVGQDWATNTFTFICFRGLPRWLNGKESACQCRRCEFDHWVREIPWRKKWQPTTVFLPGKSCGQRSLAGYSP